MGYAYSCKEEEEYYTKWRKDLVADAEKTGDKNARMSMAKTLASMGIDQNTISTATGFSSADVQAELQAVDKNASIRIARKLASMGMETENIATATGLSSSDVQAALQANP